MIPTLSPRFSATVLVASAAAALFSGCSRKSGTEAAIKRGDEFFAAGDYVKAEIEYKNALAKDGANAHVFSRMGIMFFEQGRVIVGSRFLRRALDLRPDDQEARLKMAIFELGNSRPADARQSILQVLEKNPKHPEAPVLLAETVVRIEDVAVVRARLSRLMADGAEHAPALVGLAIVDLRERKYKEAEALLARARKADPKSHLVLSVLGQLYAAQNDPARAEQAFTEAAALAPPRSQIPLQVARFHLFNKRNDAARRLLEENITKTPDFLPSYLLLASIAETEKKFTEAVGLLDKVLAKDADHPEALMQMSQVRLGMGDKESAVTTLERAVAVFPASGPFHSLLGQARLSSGNVTGATTSLNEALRLKPDLLPAALSLARVQIGQGDFANAIKILTPFASPPANVAEAWLLLAAAYRGQGNLDQSLKIYRELAQANPKAAQFRFLEGSVLLQQGKRPEGREAIEAAHLLEPDYLPTLETLSNLDIAEQKPGAAVDRLQTYIAKNPGVATPHLLLAGIYARQSDFTKAEAALLKAIELQPDTPVAYALLSRIYIETKQTEKAISNLTASLAKNPKDFGVAYILGTLFEAQKNYPAARDAYEKSISANPKLAEALNNLAYIYSEHLVDLDKALDVAQRAREAAPSLPEVADTLGWILYKARQYPRALALLEESAGRLPSTPEVHYHLGMTYYMSGQEANARRALEQALKLKPDFSGAAEARQALAVLSADADGGTETRAALEKALALRKDDPVANLRIAALHEREGNADKAFAAYELALKANPALAPGILGLMRLHAARNESAKAIALGREARKLLPGDAQLAAALGGLAYQSGDFAGALTLLQDATRRQPDDSDALFDLANAAYALGQLPQAETALADGVRVAPNSKRTPAAREFLELLTLVQPGADPAAATKAADAALAREPANVPALMVRAAQLERNRDPNTARQIYDQVLARFPDFTPAKRRLAIIFSALPELPKTALEIATKAREAFPSDGEVARAFGLILYRQGNFARASSMLQESARTLTNDAEIQYYLGRAQHELKEDAASKGALQKALDLGLKDEFAKEARRLLTPPPEQKK